VPLSVDLLAWPADLSTLLARCQLPQTVFLRPVRPHPLDLACLQGPPSNWAPSNPLHWRCHGTPSLPRCTTQDKTLPLKAAVTWSWDGWLNDGGWHAIAASIGARRVYGAVGAAVAVGAAAGDDVDEVSTANTSPRWPRSNGRWRKIDGPHCVSP